MDELNEDEAAAIGLVRDFVDRDAKPRVTDRCVRLFGGYGYLREYPVARAWADSRVQSIFGGTTEIQQEIIARGLGL